MMATRTENLARHVDLNAFICYAQMKNLTEAAKIEQPMGDERR